MARCAQSVQLARLTPPRRITISAPMQTAAEGQDMNAPPNNESVRSGSDAVVDWLTNGTRDQRFIDNIFAEMCIRLQQAGIPLKRSTLHVLIQHPQWLGARFMWSDGMREAEIARVDFDVRAKGLTDYVAWPLYHTLGKRHLFTFSSDRSGGFDATHIASLKQVLPVLALVSEIRIKNRL